MNDTLEQLLASGEPSIRYLASTAILGTSPQAPEMLALREDIRHSERVRLLLSERTAGGEIVLHPYQKWRGAHWVLVSLADLAYPPGDTGLIPLREQVYGWLLGAHHLQSIRTVAGRTRHCASIEGNVLYAMLALGLADERADRLASSLIGWQWPDGGWNCDKNPAASHSSFMETLIPLRGLALHARLTGSSRSREAVERAAEVFLKRRLLYRLSDGQVIAETFLRLHFPCYWHYDVLFALKVMAEAGLISDPRCREALDYLETCRLPDGGFAATERFYKTAPTAASGRSLVAWGPVGRTRANEFVSLDALSVLKQAGRFSASTPG